jgi:PST family polysaccharide transporter
LTEPELEPTDLTETVVRGVGLAGIGYVLAQALTLGFYMALARLATPQDFGEFAAGSLLVNIGLLFTESGMLAALIHREDRIDEAASTAVAATGAAGLAFGLLALAASPLIGLFFHSSAVGEIAAGVSGLLFVRSLLIVPQALLQRSFSFLRRVIVEPAGVVVFGVTAVVATAKGLGAWGLVIGYYASAIADVFLSWALVRWRPRIRQMSVQMWRELVNYGRFVLAANGVMLAAEQLPVLLIGRFVGTAPLGQFRYASRLSTTPLSLIVQAGSYVLFPAFARITGDRRRFRRAMLRSLRLMCAIAFPLGFLLIPLGVPAAILLFGEEWKQAGYATMALVGVPVTGTLVSFASEALKADGRPDILTRLHIVMLTASAVAMLALLPLGLIGVAAGISIGGVAGAAYGLRRVQRLNAFSAAEFSQAILPAAVASTLMAAVLLPLQFLIVDATSHGTAVGLLLLCGEALLGLSLYVAALFLFAPDTVREMRTLISQTASRGGDSSNPLAPAPATPGSA